MIISRKQFVTAFFLLLLGVLFTAANFITTDNNLTVLPVEVTQPAFTSSPTKPLLKGQKVTGEFKAAEPYLGIVSVLFKNDKPIPDIIRFRIKEKGKRKIYYEAQFDAQQFYSLPQYPFGFPIIENSKDKTYQFEITSLRGAPGKAISIDTKNPSVITYHQFPKQYLITHPAETIKMMYKKVLFNLHHAYLLRYFVINFLPFALYLFWIPFFQFCISKKNQEIIRGELYPFKKSFSLCILLTLFSYILISPQPFDYSIFLIILIWILSDAAKNITSKSTFLATLFFVSLIPLFLFFELSTHGEKSAYIAYIFLLISTLKLIYESYYEYFVKISKMRAFKFLVVAQKSISYVINDVVQAIEYIIKKIYVTLKYSVRIFFLILVKSHPRNWKDFLIASVKVLFGTIVLISILGVLAFAGFFVISKISHQINRFAINPSIKKIEPKIVYADNKVIIRGTNFGWKQNNKIRLMNQYGEVNTDLWTDTKIIFTVPLHWKPGKIEFWVEKETLWDGKIITVKNKPVSIEILPANSSEADFERYIKGLDNLDQETLELNGYKNTK